MHKPSTTLSDNKKLTVINFFSGPGVGKSTVAADLFSKMKRAGYKVELLREIAKDHVWEQQSNIFYEQDLIFAHQHRLQRRLVDHDIDFAIVDSSLLLGLFYTPVDYPQSFKTFVRDVYDTYDNINIHLERNPDYPYVQSGRNQGADAAMTIDALALTYLQDASIPYFTVVSGDQAADQILKYVVNPHIKPQTNVQRHVERMAIYDTFRNDHQHDVEQELADILNNEIDKELVTETGLTQAQHTQAAVDHIAAAATLRVEQGSKQLVNTDKLNTTRPHGNV